MSDLGALRRELTEFSQRSFNRHLVSGTGGNLSLRVPGSDTVLITPSGVSLGDIEPEMNILVNLRLTDYNLMQSTYKVLREIKLYHFRCNI